MMRVCMAVSGVLGLLAVMQPYLGMLGIAGAGRSYEQDYLLPVLAGSILLGLASLRRTAAVLISTIGFLVVAGGLLIPWFMRGQSQGPQMTTGFVMICFVVPMGVAIQLIGGLLSIFASRSAAERRK